LRFTSIPPALPLPPASTPWREANAILARIALPAIPAARFPVGSFPARGNGLADDTKALQDAIDACHAAGGGRVVVPAGVFRTGALRLRSRVELHLAKGATLRFSDDPDRFPPVSTRYEGLECVNRSPMVYARDATDVAITGEGTLDGSLAAAWNRGDDRAGILESQLARGIPPERRLVAGRLRTSMIQTVGCARVLIQGVTLSGAQFWQLHPILSVDVTIDGVTTKDSGANSDGCDPESCDRVVIRGCSFGSGDDNIALKSGRDEDGRRLAVPCRNVVIVGCQAEGRFGFITCGSEQSGGIENVYAFGNRTYGRGVGNAVWVKSNSRRGGYTRNLNVSGFRGHVRKAAVAITMKYDGQSGSFPPAFEGIHLADFAVDGAVSVLDAEGLPESRIRGLTLSDSTFTDVTAEDDVRHAEVMRRDVSVNGRPVR
jgi:polygalacturonase